MEEFPCLHCGTFFIHRNRNQNYCSTPTCQRARKTAWQRNKMQTDPTYREDQRISNKKWQKSNPNYWKQYRKNNPDKTRRNKDLQRVRNQRNRSAASLPTPPPIQMIAKMDARKCSSNELSGYYWLVPAIAKMDAVKIYLHATSMGYR